MILVEIEEYLKRRIDTLDQAVLDDLNLLLEKYQKEENVQVGRDNAVCIFVLLISGKYNRYRLVNVGDERCA